MQTGAGKYSIQSFKWKPTTCAKTHKLRNSKKHFKHLRLQKAMRLLLAANNQATRRNEIIKSYLQLGSSSNRYAPRLPPRNKIIYKTTFSDGPNSGSGKPSQNRLCSKELPIQSFIETKTLPFCNLHTKNIKNESKQGPKNETATRSHFWDCMDSLVKASGTSSRAIPFQIKTIK